MEEEWVKMTEEEFKQTNVQAGKTATNYMQAAKTGGSQVRTISIPREIIVKRAVPTVVHTTGLNEVYISSEAKYTHLNYRNNSHRYPNSENVKNAVHSQLTSMGFQCKIKDRDVNCVHKGDVPNIEKLAVFFNLLMNADLPSIPANKVQKVAWQAAKEWTPSHYPEKIDWEAVSKEK